MLDFGYSNRIFFLNLLVYIVVSLDASIQSGMGVSKNGPSGDGSEETYDGGVDSRISDISIDCRN